MKRNEIIRILMSKRNVKNLLVIIASLTLAVMSPYILEKFIEVELISEELAIIGFMVIFLSSVKVSGTLSQNLYDEITKKDVVVKTPDSKLAEIRKRHGSIYLTRFYSYCTFLASFVIFFWWFIKQVTAEVINPERIVFGYLLEFSVVLIVAVIFLSVKWEEEQLHNDWQFALEEKFAL